HPPEPPTSAGALPSYAVHSRPCAEPVRRGSTMKMRVAAALAVAVAAAVGAAAQASQSAPPTMKSGQLTVAFGDPAIGFASGQVHGTTISNPKGYEVDLATDIAHKLGLSKLNWVYTPWAGLFKPGPKSFDLSFQEATITKQRAKTVTFSSPY